MRNSGIAMRSEGVTEKCRSHERGRRCGTACGTPAKCFHTELGSEFRERTSALHDSLQNRPADVIDEFLVQFVMLEQKAHVDRAVETIQGGIER